MTCPSSTFMPSSTRISVTRPVISEDTVASRRAVTKPEAVRAEDEGRDAGTAGLAACAGCAG